MKTTTWFRVQDTPEKGLLTIRGVDVVVYASPYDLPTAFRGAYNPQTGVFRIEFRYPDAEPAERQPGDSCVSIEVGKHSHKLLAIEVAVDEHDLDVVRLRQVLDKADKTVDRLLKSSPRSNARLNYEAVDRVLHGAKPEQLLAVE